MRLVFIHGWGFDAAFWDPLAALLPTFAKVRVDRGYFGAPMAMPDDAEPSILIGHSLGFVQGMLSGFAWAGWVAINSFPYFVQDDLQNGCVPAAALKAMRRNLGQDAAQTLWDFYSLIGATPLKNYTEAHSHSLRQGLDELRDGDCSALLKDWRKPSLALASRNDPLVPEYMTNLLGAPVSWHKDGGHCLPRSAPGWCAAQIAEFMRTQFKATE